MPRPSVPTEKFPFQGVLWSANHQTQLGRVRGLFFRGLEKGDPTWRGQILWEEPSSQLLYPGDTVCLGRDGFRPLQLVIMGLDGRTVCFRCCESGSPVVPPARMPEEQPATS